MKPKNCFSFVDCLNCSGLGGLAPNYQGQHFLSGWGRHESGAGVEKCHYSIINMFYDSLEGSMILCFYILSI